MKSVELLPVSALSAVTVAAAVGAVVSRVKLSVVEVAVAPASVWRTITFLAPSPVRVKLVPVNVVQFVPPSVLYCRVAPDASPNTFTWPLLVMPSVDELPVSATSARVGATTRS